MDILTFKKEVVKVEKISFNQYLINEFKEHLKGESFTRDLKQKKGKEKQIITK